MIPSSAISPLSEIILLQEKDPVLEKAPVSEKIPVPEKAPVPENNVQDQALARDIARRKKEEADRRNVQISCSPRRAVHAIS